VKLNTAAAALCGYEARGCRSLAKRNISLPPETNIRTAESTNFLSYHRKQYLSNSTHQKKKSKSGF